METRTLQFDQMTNFNILTMQNVFRIKHVVFNPLIKSKLNARMKLSHILTHAYKSILQH